MKLFIYTLFLLFAVSTIIAQADKVELVSDSEGTKLVVNGKDFMMNGMNWDYFPIGTTNPSYDFWNKSDDFIRAALDHEMLMFKNMGGNVLRLYTGGIKPKWIQYIYEKYGIYTMLNHTFGRYGLTLDGTYVPNTDYADPRVRELLISESRKMVEEFKGTPGIIMYMLGNENNYGLFWDGAETEDIPIEERRSTLRARPMYKLFNDATLAMKQVDSSIPIAICNGDLLFLDVIAEECPDVDVFGTNVYRGMSFGDMWERVKNEYGKPVVLAEFGSDVFNTLENTEDQKAQAEYAIGNWKEIYQNAAGMGLAGNSLGGFTFQFSDGWWKYAQTKNLDVHDNVASWENGGYTFDHIPGENNMNEEWFGVCAKGPTSIRGLYKLFPRAAYYVLKEAHKMNPYNPGTSVESIENYFNNIQIMDAVIQARGDKAALSTESTKKVRLSGLRAELSTFNTGGNRITTPDQPDPEEFTYPNQLGFDHMQSFFMNVEANPAEGVRANVSMNVLGNVASNPINEVYYENRGRARTFVSEEGQIPLNDINRVAIYNADFNWNHKYFNLTGFYRTGHFHWGYEGDFFGLYPEANYGPNIDIYNGNAPFGFEFEGKRDFKDLKVAFGPELWWGANPAVLVKYNKNLAGFDVTGIFHEDIDRQGNLVSSFAVPVPQTRRVTLHAKKEFGSVGLEFGGIWGGQPLNGREYQIVDEVDGEYTVYQNEIGSEDNWGGKVKMTFSSGPFNFYAQGAAMGLVAGGGADQTITYTGWRLKDSGSGNQTNVLSGFTYRIGDFQIAPNFLWQKPIVGPISINAPAPARPRNILDDPFSVRVNRETVAGELLITYDPTPGTFMYNWDSDMVEDAKLAVSAGIVYRHHPTEQDAAIGIFADGRSLFAFPGSAPAQDLWEAHARIVSKINPDLGIIATMYGGTAQANGSDDRLLQRFGTDIRMIYKQIKLISMVKVNDWGPYDYHRDFNLTFPLQIMADISTTVGKPDWFNLPDTKMGLQYIWRSLDQYSPRYCPGTTIDNAGNVECDPELPGVGNGSEWQIRTYFHVNIGM